MDRLLIKRGLVALCGLALISTAAGCRDRNLRVPPAQYTEGSAPGSYPAAPMTPTDPATIDPYGGAAYDASSYGATGSDDPAAAGAVGYDPAASGTAGYDPAAAAASYGAYPSAGYGTDPSAPASYDAGAYGGTLASPSSPGVGTSSYPPAGMEAPAASAADGAPADLMGFDGGVTAPPIPDALPAIP